MKNMIVVKLKKEEKKLIEGRKTGFILEKCYLCGTPYIKEVVIDDKYGKEFLYCCGGFSVDCYTSTSKKLLTIEQVKRLKKDK